MAKFKRFSRKYIAFGQARTKWFQSIKHHPFVIPVTTFLVLFFVSCAGLVLLGSQTLNPTDSHVVRLNVDGQERVIPTRADTVKDLLGRLRIEVGEHDIVKPDLDSQILEDNITIKVLKAKPVTIVDSGHKTSILSAYEDPKEVVSQAGITIHSEDGVKIDAPQQAVGNVVIGQQYVVDRAKEISVNLYGNKFTVRTRADTVGDLLNEKNIKIIPGDTIQPDVATKTASNQSVFIVRVGKKVETNEEAIPAPEETVDDPELAVGAVVTREAGSNGKKLVTYEVETHNGQEVSRVVLQEVIASNPIKRVLARGTKVVLSGGKAEWLVAAGISPADYAAVDYIISRESGWCPTKWQGEHGGCPAYHGTPTSSGVGYGLCQATPGYKMASAGADWGPNPVTQLKWCTGYASRYGGWQGAYRFWIVNHWW